MAYILDLLGIFTSDARHLSRIPPLSDGPDLPFPLLPSQSPIYTSQLTNPFEQYSNAAMEVSHFDSPFEAIVVDYTLFEFFTTVNSFWTWAAFVAAVVGFWRIRTVGSLSRHKSNASYSFQNLDDSRKPSDATPSAALEKEPVPVASTSSYSRPTAVCSVKDDGVRLKVKFTVNYGVREDGSDEIEAVCSHGPVCYGDDGVEESGDSPCVECWVDGRLNRVNNLDGFCLHEEPYRRPKLPIRTVELGWYRYQDLTVINGSVVRLWGC